ncbi:hypothetical protein F5051DRAFT_487077 [Lentinula edodes]|nr:hypothetical protein F5051DRAFT_487077 [Lentinula edodes]
MSFDHSYLYAHHILLGSSSDFLSLLLFSSDVHGEARYTQNPYAHYNQNSYAHHNQQLSSPLDDPGNGVPTSNTGAMRPQPPMVFTDLPYTSGTQPSSWPESAQPSSSPCSPFPPTPGVSGYEWNQSGGHLYQNLSTSYPNSQGEINPGFRIIDPQGHYTAYPAPAVDEGLTMISPSSLASFEFGLKKATVASTKVREQADRKRKSQAKFYCSFCSAGFTAKHNLQLPRIYGLASKTTRILIEEAPCKNMQIFFRGYPTCLTIRGGFGYIETYIEQSSYMLK